MSRPSLLLSLVLCLHVLGFAGPTYAEEAVATVLITGANRGIGLAMSEAFKAGGYDVIGTARKPDEADDLKKIGARVEQLDVTDAQSVAALKDRLADVEIDILVNNAGILGRSGDDLEEADLAKIALELDVNTLGPLRVTKALLPNVLASERKMVVNISSMMGSQTLNTWGCCIGYRASKAALNSINTTLAVAYADEKMTFVVLHPGYVQTDLNEGRGNISAAASGDGLFKVIESLGPDDNGKFYDYQGEAMPW
ncbi:MAG: SDR family oxidoreductase [Pseudomonadota bacterium]